MADPRHARGREAEEAAARLLERAGLRILARNVRFRAGELDLVCRDGARWVFVEVKARRAGWDDGPGAAVAWGKRRRLVGLAQLYLRSCGLAEVPCRFDVVEVTLDGNRAVAARHLPGAFDAAGW
jgi:putative endonuclease